LRSAESGYICHCLTFGQGSLSHVEYGHDVGNLRCVFEDLYKWLQSAFHPQSLVIGFIGADPTMDATLAIDISAHGQSCTREPGALKIIIAAATIRRTANFENSADTLIKHSFQGKDTESNSNRLVF
jgi:hypothetical protein